MQINDSVYIRPTSSMHFGGRRGKVAAISDDFVSVVFDTIPFRFCFDEIMTERDYNDWMQRGTVYCTQCGKDITGLFSTVCEDCLTRIDTEGGWLD